MNSLFFVVCIVAIGCATALLSQYMKTRAQSRDRDSDDPPDDILEKMDALEERIRVLERIVTENKVDLREQINRL